MMRNWMQWLRAARGHGPAGRRTHGGAHGPGWVRPDRAAGVPPWLLGLVVCVVWLGSPAARASDASDARSLVEKARATVEAFENDPDMAAMRAGLKEAKGALVFPQVLRAGFFIGGSGGNGVLLVHDSTSGAWHGPAFYTLAVASLGLQAGASSGEMVMLINSQKTLDSLYANKLKLGVDASVALGPKSVDKSAAVGADFVVFSKVKGLFAGIAVDGGVLDVRQSLNAAFYGRAVTPVDILVRLSVSQPEAGALRAAMAAAR